jgi:hypothetical protein
MLRIARSAFVLTRPANMRNMEALQHTADFSPLYQGTLHDRTHTDAGIPLGRSPAAR